MFYKTLIFILVFSVASPYVIGPFKIDHFAWILIFIYAVVYIMLKEKNKLPKFVLYYFLFLLYMYLISFLNIGALNIKVMFGALERYTKPLFILISMIVFSNLFIRNTNLFLKTVVILAVISTIVSLLQVMPETRSATYIIVDRFWSGGYAEGVDSTAIRAMRNFRFVSIYDRPSVAGLAFVTYITLFYYMLKYKPKLKTLAFIGIAASLIGGFLCASKIFVLGFIIFMMFVMKDIEIKKLVYLSILISIFALFIIGMEFGDIDSSIGYVVDTIVKFDEIFLTRYGEGGFVSNILNKTQDDIFYMISGYGFGKLEVVDSLYAEIFISGGIVGMMLFIFAFVKLYFIKHIKKNDGTELVFFKKVFAPLFFIYIFAGLGSPTLVANRISIIFWMIIGYIIILNLQQKRENVNL